MTTPAFVTEWRAFLATVNVSGAIPIVFDVVAWGSPTTWLLRSTMHVPDRADPAQTVPIIFQNKLPDSRTDALRRDVIKQRVLGCFQHEALESIFVDGERAFNPHKARWYSNLVADWRYMP